MKKIMFSDKFGLTQMVLDGQQTMTRRFATDVTSCPRYAIGEIIAIAQSYEDAVTEWIHLMMDKSPLFNNEIFSEIHKLNNIGNSHPGIGNKMFVKARLMPYKIRITGNKIEHLQDITNNDCLNSGIYQDDNFDDYNGCFDDTPWYSYFEDNADMFNTPREAYASLVDGICGKGTWDSNPLVFVYEFELIK